MNKTSITILLLFVNWVYLNAQDTSQAFDGEPDVDIWEFSTNIPFYSENNSTDLWNIQLSLSMG